MVIEDVENVEDGVVGDIEFGISIDATKYGGNKLRYDILAFLESKGIEGAEIWGEKKYSCSNKDRGQKRREINKPHVYIVGENGKEKDKEQETCKCGHSKRIHGSADINKRCYEPGCKCQGFEQQYIVVIIDSVITYEEAENYGHAEALFKEVVDAKRGLNVYLAKVVKFEATPLEGA